MKILQRKLFSKSELTKLAQVISEAEKTTSGEIRVVIRHWRHWKERNLSLHELALKEFMSLGMQNTRDRTGTLILLLVSERVFHIIADEGIHSKVADGTWDAIAAEMSASFREGKYFDGLQKAIRAVGNELSSHFPPRPDDRNELPDEIVEH